MEITQKSLYGLWGWPVLLIIMFAASAVMIGYNVVTEFLPVFTDGTWERLSHQPTPYYHPTNTALLLFGLGGNLLFALGALVVLILLLRKSKHAPRAAIIWLVGIAIFLAIDLLWVALIPLNTVRDDIEADRELLATIARAAIWIPYLRVSRRVQATFVH